MSGDRGDPLLFLRKFLRHGKRVASFWESSRYMAAAMCRAIDPGRPQTILELGAGAGAVTRTAQSLMHVDSRLLAVEIDPDFAALLAGRCPRAEVLCCDVAELGERLPALGVGAIDVVINCLPTPSLPKAVNLAVGETVARFAPDSPVSQLTIMPLVYWPMYRRLYEQVRFQFVAANVPPGGVYHCRRLRPDFRDHLPGH
jgi:phosphatidylethanolamine/phosphatidyl-N-methylethanolamine N-methyltransferase